MSLPLFQRKANGKVHDFAKRNIPVFGRAKGQFFHGFNRGLVEFIVSAALSHDDVFRPAVRSNFQADDDRSFPSFFASLCRIDGINGLFQPRFL